MSILKLLGTAPLFAIDIVSRIGKKIIDVGKRLFSTLINGDEVKEQKPFNVVHSTADDISNISSILANYKGKVKVELNDVESEVISICKEVFGSIIESLEFANQYSFFYKIDLLKRKIDLFLSSLTGIFEYHTAKRLSLDDEECLMILKMMQGDTKAAKMTEFKRKVLLETIDDISKKLNDFSADFFENMEMTVEIKLEHIEKNLYEKVEKFNILELKNKIDTDKYERVMMETFYKLELAQFELSLNDMEV